MTRKQTLEAQREAINAELSKIYAKEKRAELRKTQEAFTATTKREALVWFLQIEPNASTYPEPYQTADRLACEGNGVIHGGGYWNDTNQCCLGLKVSRRMDLASVVADVEHVLPFMRPMGGDYGGKVFSIHEDSCSEARTFDLTIKEDGRCVLGGMRHYSRLVDGEFPDIMSALTQIQKVCPYTPWDERVEED